MSTLTGMDGWVTVEDLVREMEALEASMPGWEHPEAYALGVELPGGVVDWRVVNYPNEHQLPALVLGKILGYRNGSATYHFDLDVLDQAIGLLEPAGACDVFEHPNLWAWQRLRVELAESEPPTGARIVTVLIGDRHDPVSSNADGELRASLGIEPHDGLAMTDPAPVGYYEWLDFNSPMTGETADRLVAELAATGPSRVLDVGCGWAELLLRVLAVCPDATGHGIDSDDVLIERARRNARDRGLTDRVTFSDAVAGEESADVVLNVGAEHVFGRLDEALDRLWLMVRPGGRLLLGTQFWEQPPTSELVEAIGQVPTLSGLIGAAVEVGWRPIGLKVATPDDWDHFEFGFLADWEHTVMSPTTTAEAERARQAADEHLTSYLERRGVLGFAFLTLGRPPAPSVSPRRAA